MSGAPTIRAVAGPDAAVDALLARHHAAMRAGSPEESCHVMTAEALRAAGARVYALQGGDGELCAVGALKPLPAGQGPGGAHPAVELKSMHVAEAHRGQGMGAALLRHLLDEARASGAVLACLETGTQPGFAAARGLYTAAGFAPCPPFAGYRRDPLSVFMARPLAAQGACTLPRKPAKAGPAVP
jgi:putative acetyltransferase